MIKVAIITRTKSRPVLLKRALQSVANQTYGEYVHIIVNDGGQKDDVEKLVARLPVSQQEKTQVFHRDESSNAPDTIFNESIDRIESEFFAIHDDDDTWHPEFLSHMIAKLDNNPTLGAVVARTDKIVEEIAGTTIRPIKTTHWMSDLKVINLYRQCIDNQFTPIATLFSRKAYEAVGKFDASLPVVGDWEFGIRLLQKYDADFVDPGYALAYYHHRKFKKGSEGNTSFAGNDKHRYYTNVVMNRYLRQELAGNYLGVGYIMSQLKYDQASMVTMVKRFLPNAIVSRVKKRLSN